MQSITLLNSTGLQNVDDILIKIVGLLEITFPEQIRGFYVTGSYCDGTAVSTSDIDLTIVFKGDQEEASWLREVGGEISLLSPILIDMGGVSEQPMFKYGHRIKLASLLIFGEDILDKIPLAPIKDYSRQCMRRPIYFMTHIARDLETCVFPLNYPNISGEFYGYDRDPIENQENTKVLMSIVGNISTAIIAIKAKELEQRVNVFESIGSISMTNGQVC